MRIAEKFSIPLLLTLGVLMIGGFFSLRGKNAALAGNEISFPRAIFVVTNAATLTGFQLNTNVNDYEPFGQRIVFMLIVASTLVYLLVGGWALARVLGLRYTDWQIARTTFVIYLLAMVIGANVLMDKGVDVWAALFNSASAFGNAGQWLGGLPTYASGKTHLLLLPLAFVGGLGIPVIVDLVASAFHRTRVAPHTLTVLMMSAVLYVAGAAMLFTFEKLSEPEPESTVASTLNERVETARQAALRASTEALNSRSLGMPLGSFSALAKPSQWIVLLLMLIGASPAGAGGGLKTTTAYVLCRDSVRLISGREVGTAFGLASVWLLVYLGGLFVVTVLLIFNFPQIQSDRLLFLAASAIGNAGLSQEPVTLGANGLYLLSLAMLFGKLAPLGLLWWTAINRPGEIDVAVG